MRPTRINEDCGVLTDLTDRLLIYLISADTTDTSHALKGKIIYPTVNDAKLGVNLARCDEEDIQKGYALPDHMLEEYFRRLYESCTDLLPPKGRGFPEVSGVTPLYGCYSVMQY